MLTPTTQGRLARLRHPGRIAASLAAAGALIASLSGFGAASAATAQPAAAPQAPAATTLPAVYEQDAVNQTLVLAHSPATVVTQSPVLPEGSYLVHLAILVANIQPGDNILCGLQTTTSGDAVYGNYGDVTNEGTAADNDNCVVSGVVEIKNPSDHIQAWAGVYSGPTGSANAGSWSMNELRVGKVTQTSP